MINFKFIIKFWKQILLLSIIIVLFILYCIGLYNISIFINEENKKYSQTEKDFIKLTTIINIIIFGILSLLIFYLYFKQLFNLIKENNKILIFYLTLIFIIILIPIILYLYGNVIISKKIDNVKNVWCKTILENDITNFVLYLNIILIILVFIVSILLFYYKLEIINIFSKIINYFINTIKENNNIFKFLMYAIYVCLFIMLIVLPLYFTNNLTIKYNTDIEFNINDYNNTNVPDVFKNLVNMHNNFRASYDSSPLIWNKELCNEAEIIAKQLNMYKLIYNQEKSYKGVNIAGGYSGCPYIKFDNYNILTNTATNNWLNNSIINYDYNNPENNNGSNVISAVNGLWKNANKIGCAIHTFNINPNIPSVACLVCKYDIDNGNNKDNINIKSNKSNLNSKNNISKEQKCIITNN